MITYSNNIDLEILIQINRFFFLSYNVVNFPFHNMSYSLIII